MSFFDECYQRQPDLSQKPADLNSFWKTRLKSLQSTEPEIKSKKRGLLKGVPYLQKNLTFHSVGNIELNVQMLAPISPKKKPAIVIFSDYLEKPAVYKSFLSHGFIQFSLKLRGHEAPLLFMDAKGKPIEKKSYGYFALRTKDTDNYYMAQLLLDAYRMMEIVFGENKVDQDRVGVWGRGIGASMGLFVSRFFGNIKCQAIQSPDFCDLNFLGNSKAFYAQEILSTARDKNELKQFCKQHRHLDSMYFADGMRVPSSIFTDLSEKKLTPESAFAVLHLLRSEKEMYVYTDSNQEDEALNSQNYFKEILNFFKRKLA